MAALACVAPGDWGRRLNLSQRLPQIGDNVRRVLQPNREANEAIADAQAEALYWRQLEVAHLDVMVGY